MKPKKLISIFALSIFIAGSCISSANAKDVSYTTKRLAGDNRVATAAEIALEYSKLSPTDTAIIATSTNYPDALAAAPLAAKYNAPILLTDPDKLNVETARTLQNLGIKKVIIIGGSGVVSKAVGQEIKKLGIETDRIAGVNRYETALQIAARVQNNGMLAVVNGEDFADALSIAPYAAKKQMPILLVPPHEDMPENIKEFLKGKQLLESYIIGDESLISEDVKRNLFNVVRIEGATKYDRNINVINTFKDQFRMSTVCLATGENYPDALAGSVYAGKLDCPIILTGNNLGKVKEFIDKTDCKNQIYLGGNGAISIATEKMLSSSADIPLSSMENDWSKINSAVPRRLYNYAYGDWKNKLVKNVDLVKDASTPSPLSNTIEYMKLKYNKDYDDVFAIDLLYYYNPYIQLENSAWPEKLIDAYLSEKENYKISSTAEFITDPSLTYSIDNYIVQRGTLRITYSSSTSSRYLNSMNLQPSQVYEKDMDLYWMKGGTETKQDRPYWNHSDLTLWKISDLSPLTSVN